MFDYQFVRENFELIKKTIKDKNEKADISGFTELDLKRRTLVKTRDDLRTQQKQISLEVAKLKKDGKECSELIQQSKSAGEEEKKVNIELEEAEKALKNLVMWIPNIPNPSVPLTEQKTIREYGQPRTFDFEPLPASELCEHLDILDFKRASKVSGAGFPCYKGAGAKLELALINFMIALHDKQGYTPIFPPFLITPESLFNTGQLPKMQEDMYYINEDKLYLNPTAEVPLINLYQDEMLENLPLKYVGYTACFRREAGSYGKETKGLKRVHQFNKVELIKFTRPEESYNELEAMLVDAEEVLKKLGLSYRVILLPANDMSFASAKTYDIEAWSTVAKEWLEVSSCSNSEDFQARRGKIRFKEKGKTSYVHILNGSGVATARTFIALVEQYQTKGRTIKIPEVLVPYMGMDEIKKG
jgi:seryl-tRNA synthetase